MYHLDIRNMIDDDDEYVLDQVQAEEAVTNKIEVFEVPRLEALSLRIAIRRQFMEYDLVKEKHFSAKEMELKPKLGIIWKLAVDIVSRTEEFGEEAIRLMGQLSYFGVGRLKAEIFFTPTRYMHPVFDPKIDNLFKTLEKYYLVELERQAPPHSIFLNGIVLKNELLIQVIQERNVSHEVDLLKDCYNILNNNTDTQAMTGHFDSLWRHASKHMELIKEIKTIAMDYHKSAYLSQMIEKYEEIFCPLDEHILKLRYYELLELLRPGKSSQTESQTTLAKCTKSRIIFEDFMRTNKTAELCFGFENLARKIYDVGIRIQSKEAKNKYLEEAFKYFIFIFNFDKNTKKFSHMVEIFIGLAKCLKELDKISEILSILRELRGRLVLNKSKVNEQLPLLRRNTTQAISRDSCLSILTNTILQLNPPVATSKGIGKATPGPGYEQEFMAELLYIFKSMYNCCPHVQMSRSESDRHEAFLEVTRNLVICLNQFGRFNEIVKIISETDLLWKGLIMNFNQTDNEAGVKIRHIRVPCFKFQSLVYRIALSQKLDYSLKEKLLRQSLNITRKLFELSSKVDITYDGWGKSGEPPLLMLILKSLAVLGEANVFLSFCEDYEKLLKKKVESERQLAENVIKFTGLVAGSLKSVKIKIISVPFLEAVISSTKKHVQIIKEGTRNEDGTLLKKIGKCTIKLCKYLIEVQKLRAVDGNQI